MSTTTVESTISHQLIGLLLHPLPSVKGTLDRLIRYDRRSSIAGKRVVITGSSSGIGRTTALRLAGLGARVALVARRESELEQVRAEIHRAGGQAYSYPCDLTDSEAVEAMVATVLAEMGGVDILINNAGRSIRRSIDEESLDRLHDFERTMAINYFGSVALTLALLPTMADQGEGHIINISSVGVAVRAMPKFAAYHASKSALTAFGNSVAAEKAQQGIAVTAVHFPLVRTEMIAPTEKYRSQPTLSCEQATDWIVRAIRYRPSQIAPSFIPVLRGIGLISPSRADYLWRKHC